MESPGNGVVIVTEVVGAAFVAEEVATAPPEKLLEPYGSIVFVGSICMQPIHGPNYKSSQQITPDKLPEILRPLVTRQVIQVFKPLNDTNTADLKKTLGDQVGLYFIRVDEQKAIDVAANMIADDIEKRAPSTGSLAPLSAQGFLKAGEACLARGAEKLKHTLQNKSNAVPDSVNFMSAEKITQEAVRFEIFPAFSTNFGCTPGSGLLFKNYSYDASRV